MAPKAPQHRHRASSALKQVNKKNKRSKASKRFLSRSAGGKVNRPASLPKPSLSSCTVGSNHNKANRNHEAKQRRESCKRRKLADHVATDPTHGGVPPRLVGLISLSSDERQLEDSVLQFLLHGADSYAGHGGGSVTAKYQTHKKNGLLTFLTNTSSFRHHNEDTQDALVIAALDLCSVCDIVVFLLDGNASADNSTMDGMSVGMGGGGTTSSTLNKSQTYESLVVKTGDAILAAVKAQGLPTPLTLLVHSDNDDDGSGSRTVQSGYQSQKSARRHDVKRRLELKRFVSRFATTEFGEGANVAELELQSPDIAFQGDGFLSKHLQSVSLTKEHQSKQCHSSREAFIRTLCTTRASPPKWVADMSRAYVLSNGNSNANCHSYDADIKELKITGFIRGKVPWNVNQLVHVPKMGTFGVKCVERADLPEMFSGVRNKTSIAKGAVQENENENIVTIEIKDDGGSDDFKHEENDNCILAICNPKKREPLSMFATPDALEGEQNLIGFDEGGHYEEEHDNKSSNFQKGVARPAGWSDYQSAWLDAVEDDTSATCIGTQGQDHGELAFSLNQKSVASGGASVLTSYDETMIIDNDDANGVSAEERMALSNMRKKDKKEDLIFPDEVQVQEHENARDRFARYRSIKSFRKSNWDPKENLPNTYGTLYHFASFKSTQNEVMAKIKDLARAASSRDAILADESDTDNSDKDMASNDDDSLSSNKLLDECVPSGSYVTLTIEGVPVSAYNRISPSSLLVAVCLLPHENKASVLHMGLSQTTQCDPPVDAPVKSKDVLTFRCGWRTWRARPVFSQNNLNSDKHKFERFMPTEGAFFAASVLGPVTYTPCPVLVFSGGSVSGNRTSSQLVALGSMLGADANRIVVKRILLTGYPTRVHKRHATVKYMFYNPEDVKWFKPAGLTTKHGLQGNIIESVGDHGTMKCLFNAPIKQHDTVCLPLYKRIFPKYAPTTVLDSDGAKVVKEELLVV